MIAYCNVLPWKWYLIHEHMYITNEIMDRNNWKLYFPISDSYCQLQYLYNTVIAIRCSTFHFYSIGIISSNIIVMRERLIARFGTVLWLKAWCWVLFDFYMYILGMIGFRYKIQGFEEFILTRIYIYMGSCMSCHLILTFMKQFYEMLLRCVFLSHVNKKRN